MKRFFQYLVALAARAAGGLVGMLPRSWYFPAARGLAHVLYLFPAFGGVSFQNVRAAYPDAGRAEWRRMAKGSIENLLVTLCEFFWLRHHKDVFLPDLIEVSPCTREVVTDYLAHPGNGVLFVTPHHGNWEFAGQMLSLGFHFKVSTIVRSPQNPFIGELLSKGRGVSGVELIESKGAARGFVSALKNGRAIGLLIDQNTRVRDGGDFVNFYGLPVPMTQLPARLARRNGLRIAFGGVYREGTRLFMDAVLLPKECSEYASDLELSQAIMERIETLVRRHPEQYLWMYRRFQYIPADADEALKKRYPDYAVAARPSFYAQSARRANRKNQDGGTEENV